MDPVFNDKLRRSRVKLIDFLDLDSIMPYMIQSGIITRNMDDVIASKQTRNAKIAEFLNILERRPNVKQELLAALRLTHQSYIVDILEGLAPAATPASTPTYESQIFSDLINSVFVLKPGKQQSDRHGEVLLTSTQTYVKKPPISKLGERELPFLFAVKAFGYSHDTVLGWPLAPSKVEFTRSLTIYEKEVSEVKSLIQALESGGVHLIVKPRDERLIKLLVGYNNMFKPFSISTDGVVHIIVPTISIRIMPPIEVDLLCCLVHLLCFSEHKFIFRKSCPPKPNCYLLFRSNGMGKSVVVASEDIKIVEEAIGMDESVFTPNLVSIACPW